MYRRESYVFDGARPVHAIIREYTRDDFEDIIEVQRECFPPPFPSELWWNEEQLNNHVALFPEGAHCIEVEGALAGSITGLIVNWSPNDTDHSWSEITDHGYIRNHDPSGNTLYVVDISVRPRFQKLGLGKLLMFSMYDVVIELNLDRLLGGARMPGYSKVASQLTPEHYLKKILAGEIHDPIVTFLLRCGRVPVRITRDYLHDEESRNHGVLMEWRNPFRQ
ncbi:MAG: GNAT family N-acetyltransferase [Candidatus Hydrogenedentes bacterium]|nr:GNAT family N-acetyltransferase [Candidatus Hydrogenedentota bacterium]